MEILLKETQQVVTETEFRAKYPDSSFPAVLTSDILNDFNAVAIMEGPRPLITNQYQYYFRQGIEEINGKWFSKFILGPIFEDNEVKTAIEQENEYKAKIDANYAESIRTERNKLLIDSDWTQVADAPVNKEIWAAYRQALRDITNQESFPFNITYPEKPV